MRRRVVLLLATYGKNCASDVCGLSEKIADQLLEQGFAVDYRDEHEGISIQGCLDIRAQIKAGDYPVRLEEPRFTQTGPVGQAEESDAAGDGEAGEGGDDKESDRTTL